MAPMNRINLRHRIETAPDDITHWIDLDGLPTWISGPRSLYWKIRKGADPVPSPVLDPFVIGLALQLAAAGGEVRVHGAISRRALFNVHRLLELRRATSPGRYQDLRIVPDDLVEGQAPVPGDRRTVLAFSGGLDSTHAALRNAACPERPDSLDLKALVMVHGFDAAIERPDIFERMLERATPLATRLGIDLRSVATNSKYLQGSLWPQTSTPLAATALALFGCPYGIFGGGLPYGANFLPLGHQPLFDQYCSGAGFTLLTDGAGLTRKQKIVNLSADASVLQGLRVCWQGSDVSKNCGQCEKCTLTKLNLRMAGLDESIAFDTKLDIRRLYATAPKTLYTARDLAEYTWRDIRDDPALAEETRVVREILAAVSPVSVMAACRAALFDFFLPRPLRMSMARLRGWGRLGKTLAKRRVNAWIRAYRAVSR